MKIRYYVRRAGQQFLVLREGKAQGMHGSLQRAVESASFMGSIEANRMRATVDLFVEDAGGRLMLEHVIEPAAPGMAIARLVGDVDPAWT